MNVLEISQSCLSFALELGDDFDLRKLFDELYSGPNEERHIANFLGSLHNDNRRTLDAKIESWLMDSVPPSFTPDERLLLRIRAESAAGSLPTLTGAICHRTAPELDLKSSTTHEAIFWALTSFWSLIYTPALMRAARILSRGGRSLLEDCSR